MADSYNLKFLETSAKDNQNVEDAFTLMAREIKGNVVAAAPARRDVPGGKPPAKLKPKDGKNLSTKNSSGCC